MPIGSSKFVPFNSLTLGAKMTGLILPNLSSDQMGQVTITMTMTNWVDQVMSDRKFIPVEEVRSRKLDNVLVVVQLLDEG